MLDAESHPKSQFLSEETWGAEGRGENGGDQPTSYRIGRAAMDPHSLEKERGMWPTRNL